ncbi:MAG: hypothetical protein M1817_005647 [Caeruleum heppii]|nr:MAG: hypothetical protein M1817_005647 [Caeruleum heppii]
MNFSATFSVFKLLRDPSLCLPHSTIATFQQLPVPLSTAFGRHGVDIRAVVVDKDNCFAVPKQNVIYKPYTDKFRELREAYPGARLLIVSNSAGSHHDFNEHEAAVLEANTGVEVLRHEVKKPGTHPSIWRHFQQHPETGVTRPSQIAVVGDRLFTDVMMANMMGSWAVWVRKGVVDEKSLFTTLEGRLADFLRRKGYMPPTPGLAL